MFGSFVRIFLFVATAALPGVLFAKTYYVSPEGDDGGPGTLEAPFATVQSAHDNEALQPGDVIYLRGVFLNTSIQVTL